MEFGVQVHVLHGLIEQIQQETVGVLGVLLCGNDPGLRAAEERLRARGYRWQSIQETVTPPAPPRPVAQADEGAQHV